MVPGCNSMHSNGMQTLTCQTTVAAHRLGRKWSKSMEHSNECLNSNQFPPATVTAAAASQRLLRWRARSSVMSYT